MRRIEPTFKLVVILINLMFYFAFSNAAEASQTIKGRIKKIDNAYLLVTKNQIAYTLDFMNEVSEQQIKRLNNGDFASVTANVSSIAASLVYVTSVDYIGLASIIGVWRSQTDMCYEFASFTRLYTFAVNKDGKCVRTIDADQFNKYNYFINPDVDAWNMLISNPTKEFFGELNIISDDHIELELFDNQTDATLGTMILRR